MAKLGKNTMRALKSANSVDDLIQKFSQPQTRRYRGNNEYIHRLLKNGKPYFSEWVGMVSPAKLNISADTLAKIRKG